MVFKTKATLQLLDTSVSVTQQQYNFQSLSFNSKRFPAKKNASSLSLPRVTLSEANTIKIRLKYIHPVYDLT